MHGRVGSEWTSSEPMSDINVVPLVDVLLVLLVIFMITAPIISHTLDVQLPRASLAPGTRADQTLIITIDRKGTLAVNERVMGPIRSQEAGRRFNTAINRWKAKYRGMGGGEIKRLRTLEEENRRLKSLVADQALDIQILKEVAEGNF